MSYRTVLVHLDAGRQAYARLDFALRLATSHGANLIGLFTLCDTDAKSFYAAAGAAEFLIRERARRERARRELAAHFHDAAARAGVSAEWRAPDGHPNRIVPLHARHADLAIVGQFDSNDPDAFVAAGFVENLLLSAGRPVLAVPYAGAPASFAVRPLIAWDCSRAATRAVFDALPLLRSASQVLVVTFAPSDEDAEPRLPGADIATVLARHGIGVEVHARDAVPRRETGEMLLSCAADLNADLIVAGAYGHARLMQWVMGGVTRTLLRSMTMPVLFSH